MTKTDKAWRCKTLKQHTSYETTHTFIIKQ